MSDQQLRGPAGLSEQRRRLLELRLERARRMRDRIPPRRQHGPAPASFAQERLWVIEQIGPGRATYNVPFGMRLTGDLDVVALRQALEEIVARHDVLRTRLQVVDEQLVQVVEPVVPVPFEVLDLRGQPPARREERAREAAGRAARAPFDLGTGPCVRATLVCVEERSYVFVLAVHHVVSDAWSTGILLRELGVLYAAFRSGAPSPLPPRELQYADFAAWQRDRLQGDVVAREVEHWRMRLGGEPPVVELPADRPRPPRITNAGATLRRPLPSELMSAVRAFAGSRGLTPFMTLLAAFHALVHRLTGLERVVVGSPIANRNRRELEDLVGFFVNLLVLDADCRGDPTFDALAQQVRETTLDAYARQDVPFEKIVEGLEIPRDPSRTPLVQVVFSLEEGTTFPLELPGVAVEFAPVETRTSRFDLTVVAFERAEEAGLWAEYSSDLFDESTVERFLRCYETLLRDALAHPERPLSTLAVVPEDELRVLLDEWNETEAPWPPATVHGLFERQARATPYAVAATFEGRDLTYGELDSRASALADRARLLGAGPEACVGVLVERSLDQIVAVVGTLKTGAAYVPLDPRHPRERRNDLLRDTGAQIVVCQRDLIPLLEGSGVRPLPVDELEDPSPTKPAPGPAAPCAPDNLAYVLYTSGSTGRPKGVLITHESATDYLRSAIELFEVRPEDRVLQFAPLTFDVSVFEIFTALLAGATLCLGRRETLLDPAGLTRLMREERVTIADLPPAVLALLEAAAFPDLRALYVGGEPFSGDLVNSWTVSGRRFVNGYGPTEATVSVTVEDCVPPLDGPPSIGRPMNNHRVYVLDERLEPVTVGVPGQLFVGGTGLGRGFLGQPGLTAASFVPDPFGTPGGRLYPTGDLVRYRPSGKLDFLGRRDNEVKISGVRIDVGEVEAALETHASVRQVAVEPWTGPEGRRRLVAYVALHPHRPATDCALREHLTHRLPAVMVPSSFVYVDSLPLTSSGKVDRRRLPQPSNDRPGLESTYAPPRSDIEQVLSEKIFGGVLGVGDVGVNDNFFDLGGNSFEAAQVVARVRESFDVELPLVALFERPTVAQLASLLADGAGQPTDASSGPAERTSSLVSLAANGSGTPVCLVHPSGGSVFCYSELAASLSPTLPLLAFQAPALDIDEASAETVEELADRYLADLREAHGGSPVVLGGWSMGAAVAWEMAQRRRREGGDVPSVVLIDPDVPVTADRDLSNARLARAFGADLARIHGRESLDLGGDFDDLGDDEQLERLGDRLLAEGLVPPELPRGTLLGRLRVFRSNIRALAAYRPQPYAGRVVFVHASESPATFERWQPLCEGGFVLERVAADHYTVLRRPAAQRVAEVLARAVTVDADRAAARRTKLLA